MARDQTKRFTKKQKRQAEHIEDSYEERGVDEDEARRRAFATVNSRSGNKKKVSRRTKKGTASVAKKASSKGTKNLTKKKGLKKSQ